MRTALFNWLWARHNAGQFILRVDDTDQERNLDSALEPILAAFRWLGLDWDEGPDVGGPRGPYYQSQRGAHYERAAQQLIDSGQAYRDFDAPEQIRADREEADREKRNYLNIRRSLEMTPAEVQAAIEQQRPHVLRLLVPRDQVISIDDGVRGHVEWNCGLVSDPVLVRGNGAPLYNFATVVDDHDLGITHVIRGEEHLTNTAVQVLIYQALEVSIPCFVHVPFITAPGTKRKLSKRDLSRYRNNPHFRRMFQRADQVFPVLGLGDSELLNPVMVEYYERIGYLPEAMINALSRLGWSLDDKTEIMSRQTIIDHFSLKRIVKGPAGLDTDKLDSYQAHWMSELTDEQRLDGVLPFLEAAGLTAGADDQDRRLFVARVLRAMGDRLKIFSDILDVAFFFEDDVEFDDKAFRKRICKAGVPDLLEGFQQKLAELNDWTAEILEAELTAYAEAHGVSAGLLIHALRIATTGQPTGPGVYECAELVGREKSLERITLALQRVRSEQSAEGETSV
jgi:glutamyl-tRNA synthetase